MDGSDFDERKLHLRLDVDEWGDVGEYTYNTYQCKCAFIVLMEDYGSHARIRFNEVALPPGNQAVPT